MLPCGAGKSLVGVSAACRIKKSCLCLATNAVSVDQWAFQFKLWSTIKDEHISRFTSDNKEKFRGMAGVVVTTYNMVAFGGKRSEDSEKIIEEIRNREWGLLLMDEVGYPLVIFEVFNIKYFRSSHMSMFFFFFCDYRSMLFLHICSERSSALQNLTASLVLLVSFDLYPYI